MEYAGAIREKGCVEKPGLRFVNLKKLTATNNLNGMTE